MSFENDAVTTTTDFHETVLARTGTRERARLMALTVSGPVTVREEPDGQWVVLRLTPVMD